MQHAWKHVERPGGSHTALDEKKRRRRCQPCTALGRSTPCFHKRFRCSLWRQTPSRTAQTSLKAQSGHRSLSAAASGCRTRKCWSRIFRMPSKDPFFSAVVTSKFSIKRHAAPVNVLTKLMTASPRRLLRAIFAWYSCILYICILFLHSR